ncbi:MAG: hypothetical protein Q7R86_03225 [bacterium]|nr:hypothetical protein [bacterium]
MTKKIVLATLVLGVGVVVGGAILSTGHPSGDYLPKAEAATIDGGCHRESGFRRVLDGETWVTEWYSEVVCGTDLY